MPAAEVLEMEWEELSFWLGQAERIAKEDAEN